MMLSESPSKEAKNYTCGLGPALVQARREWTGWRRHHERFYLNVGQGRPTSGRKQDLRFFRGGTCRVQLGAG